MNMREAFENWIKTKMRGISVGNLGEWWAWQAACEWQKQKDADLADDLWLWPENPDIQTYDKDVGDCIRNQGDE